MTATAQWGISNGNGNAASLTVTQTKPHANLANDRFGGSSPARDERCKSGLTGSPKRAEHGSAAQKMSPRSGPRYHLGSLGRTPAIDAELPAGPDEGLLEHHALGDLRHRVLKSARTVKEDRGITRADPIRPGRRQVGGVRCRAFGAEKQSIAHADVRTRRLDIRVADG
jgi:hypothetical protein